MELGYWGCNHITSFLRVPLNWAKPQWILLQDQWCHVGGGAIALGVKLERYFIAEYSETNWNVIYLLYQQIWPKNLGNKNSTVTSYPVVMSPLGYHFASCTGLHFHLLCHCYATHAARPRIVSSSPFPASCFSDLWSNKLFILRMKSYVNTERPFRMKRC